MKIRRIIEIEEETYNILKERNLTIDTNAMLKASKQDNVTVMAILALLYCLKDSKPYEERPQGDLISREALKDKLTDTINVNDITKSEWYEGYTACVQVLSELIDSAQAVETYTKDDMTREYLKGYNACKDMNERPQGEWKMDEYGLPYCNKCGIHPDYTSNFCPNCGADMRKGGAE